MGKLTIYVGAVLVTLLLLAGVADLIADAGKYRRLPQATPVHVMVCHTTEQKQTDGIVFLDGEQLKFLADGSQQMHDGVVCQVRFGDAP